MSKTSAVNDLTKKRNLEGYGLKIKKYRKSAGMTADERVPLVNVEVGIVAATRHLLAVGSCNDDIETVDAVVVNIEVQGSYAYGNGDSRIVGADRGEGRALEGVVGHRGATAAERQNEDG